MTARRGPRLQPRRLGARAARPRAPDRGPRAEPPPPSRRPSCPLARGSPPGPGEGVSSAAAGRPSQHRGSARTRTSRPRRARQARGRCTPVGGRGFMPTARKGMVRTPVTGRPRARCGQEVGHGEGAAPLRTLGTVWGPRGLPLRSLGCLAGLGHGQKRGGTRRASEQSA